MYRERFDAVLRGVDRCRAAIGKPPQEISILDIGCAQGNYSLTLAELGYRVVAMDLKLSFLRYLRLKYERGAVHCINASLEAPPFRSGFDIVLLGEVIEHVAHPDRLLATLRELLTPGGWLVLTTPNGDRFHTGLPTLSQIQDHNALESKQFKPDADGHLFLLTRDELRAETAKAGLDRIEHQYFSTPWVTGRLKFRVLTRFLPLAISSGLDRAFLKTNVLARRFAEGQMIVAQRPKTSPEPASIRE